MAVKTGFVEIKAPGASTWKPTPLPSHGGLRYVISTAVDAGRDARGFLVGNVVGDDKMKLEITYPPLDAAQLGELLRMFDRSQGGSFINDVRFYDPRTNNRITKRMYVGDRGYSPYWAPYPGGGTGALYQDITINLVEV
jgi:hypothetical protein